MFGRLLRGILKVLVILALVPLILTPIYAVVRPVSTLMLLRWVTAQPVERSWIALDDVSPAAIRAVLASEDARFCTHNGVDFEELSAVMDGADDLDEVRGASTLTMQVAKNLFLWNGRQVIRKGLEMPLALYIDFVLGKRRVLEIYFNIAEWGPQGQFGIEAGARRAFNKSARDLTPREAALMAVMLPNPIRRDAAKPSRGVTRLAGRLEARIPREGPELTACLGLGR